MKGLCLKVFSPRLGRKGMTLIEVMVFAVILGIVAAMYATYSAQQAKQNQDIVRQTRLNELSNMVDQYSRTPAVLKKSAEVKNPMNF